MRGAEGCRIERRQTLHDGSLRIIIPKTVMVKARPFVSGTRDLGSVFSTSLLSIWVKTDEVRLRLCFSSKSHEAGGRVLVGRGLMKPVQWLCGSSPPKETRGDLCTRQD